MAEMDIDAIINAVKKDMIKENHEIMVGYEGPTDFLNTGNYAINYAFSGKPDGGIPVGFITEIFGDNSCAQTASIVEVIVLDEEP